MWICSPRIVGVDKFGGWDTLITFLKNLPNLEFFYDHRELIYLFHFYFEEDEARGPIFSRKEIKHV